MEHICIVFATKSGTSISLCYWNGRIWSDLNRLLVKFFVNLYGKFGKEIAMEKHRDGEQKMGVDAVFAEHPVDDRAVTVEFLGKPTDTAVLFDDFLFDAFTYVYHSLACCPGGT